MDGVWILNTDYLPDRMFHNHPFFYTYSTQENILGVVYTDASTHHNEKIEEEADSEDEQKPTAQPDDSESALVGQYFKQYKETIKNFSKIDQILKQKHIGKIKPIRRYTDGHKGNKDQAQQFYDKNGFPLYDASDYEGQA
jgi:hypothetical protein